MHTPLRSRAIGATDGSAGAWRRVPVGKALVEAVRKECWQVRTRGAVSMPSATADVFRIQEELARLSFRPQINETSRDIIGREAECDVVDRFWQ